MRRPWWPPRRGSSRERRLDVAEQPYERVGLRAVEPADQVGEPVLQQQLDRREARSPRVREHERLTTAVVRKPPAVHQTGRLEAPTS